MHARRTTAEILKQLDDKGAPLPAHATLVDVNLNDHELAGLFRGTGLTFMEEYPSNHIIKPDSKAEARPLKPDYSAKTSTQSTHLHKPSPTTDFSGAVDVTDYEILAATGVATYRRS